MPWFLTPHGPHFVVEPGTVDEYERRDYVVMTAQQVTDYFAGVAFPDPPSFLTEAEAKVAFGLGATATDTAVTAFVDTDGTKTRAALLRDFGGQRSVSLPSGARVTPLPGMLRNEWRYNATSFIQDNVTTVGSKQYAIWVNEAGNPVIGKRNLGSDQWQTFDLSTVAGNPLGAPVNGDGHNVYVVAVDSDGFVHVAGDMHDMSLRYVRSTAAGDITAWTAPGMVGADEDGVSYPQFVHRLNGELLFVYRQTQNLADNGSASATAINAYNPATKTWVRRSIPIDGRQGTTTSNSYTNRIAVGPDGSLHIFYMWRDSAGSTNDPSIGHIRSDDGGATWSQMDGTPTATPVTKDTHVQVANIPALNQQGTDVDSNGRPHAAFTFTKGVGIAIRHLYWNGSAWVLEDALDQSREPASLTRNPRANLFCRGEDTYLIYSTGQTGPTGGGAQSVRLRNLSAADRHVDFPLIEANLGHYEATFDTLAMRERDELTMLVTAVQSEAASAVNLDLPKHMRGWGGILTFPLTTLRLAAGLADGSVMNERVWVPASAFDAWEGTPVRTARSGQAGWELADAATSSIVALSRIPDRWQAYNVDIWWANQTAGAGAIRVRNSMMPIASAQNLDTSPGNYGDATVTMTAAGNGAVVVSRTIAAQPHLTYDADKLSRVIVRRLGADAADTLAANALILGVMISPALLP